MKQFLLEAVGVRDYPDFTVGKQYTTIRGIEEGIFEDRPYVTVIDDNGKEHSCHAARFKIIGEVEKWL